MSICHYDNVKFALYTKDNLSGVKQEKLATMRPHVSRAPDILRRVQHSFRQSLKEREKGFLPKETIC